MGYEKFYSAAEAHYSKLRRENFAKADYYLGVLHSDEKYLSAYNAYNAARFDLFKAKRDGSTAKIAELNEKIEALKSEMRRIKAEKKIDDGMLLPHYSCAYCKDTGVTSDGKFCSCYKKFVQGEALRTLGLTERVYPDYDDLAKESENRLDAIYEKMRNYIEKFPNSKSPLVISGEVGVGKSMLALSTAGKIAEKGYNVIFLTAYELHAVFLKYASAPFGEKDVYVETLTDCDLLVIDDLGCEPLLGNVSLQCLYGVINERSANSKPFIITTNLTGDMIAERYGEVLFSRIFNKRSGVEIRISGKDLRLKK